MDTISLIYVPPALLAGFALHYAVFRSRVPNSQTPKLARRLVAVVVPLICLPFWVALCFGFKLLTWKPFAGDTPGSIALTNILLLAGSALVGVWISARLRQQNVIPTP
ncbi:MAG TPA: hypothetical protein VNZ53_59020 [Steroidobacteraceae bacterium]|nr:hypothetical protein [Steroidobacteraceae bacterium]